MSSRQYYTAKEAQSKLGLSKTMFFRKVNQGFIPKVVQPGMKQGLYPKRDIDALALSMDIVFDQYERIVFSKSTPADQIEEMNIGILLYGRNFVTPLSERIAFQQKSDFTFYSLKVEGRVVGYVSMFRFSDKFLNDLLQGRKIESEITLKDMLCFERLEQFAIYIDVMAVDPTLPSHQIYLYERLIVSRFIDTILNFLANGYQITTLYTVTSSVEGDQIVNNVGFKKLEGKSIAPGRVAYTYQLDEAGIAHLRTLSSRNESTV